jgi:DNA modification methylase
MIELNKIYNEDCLEGMKRIPDGSVDCIVCDLPYEVLNKGNEKAQWDNIIPNWRIHIKHTTMTQFDYDHLIAQIEAVRPLAWEYSGQTIDNILRQLKARAKEVKPHAQVVFISITIDPDGSLRYLKESEPCAPPSTKPI